MANETLSVPEEKLWEVIQVIRAGLEAKVPTTSAETKKRLKQWCDDEEAYLRRTGALIVMTVNVEPKPKKLTKTEIAHYYNTRVRQEHQKGYEQNCREIGEVPESDYFPPVKAGDLDTRKVWECEKSPTKFCVYDWDNTGEDCIFCHQPEERK